MATEQPALSSTQPSPAGILANQKSSTPTRVIFTMFFHFWILILFTMPNFILSPTQALTPCFHTTFLYEARLAWELLNLWIWCAADDFMKKLIGFLFSPPRITIPRRHLPDDSVQVRSQKQAIIRATLLNSIIRAHLPQFNVSCNLFHSYIFS